MRVRVVAQWQQKEEGPNSQTMRAMNRHNQLKKGQRDDKDSNETKSSATERRNGDEA